MSGIAGIVNPAGEPVDRILLERMAGAMAGRCPDGTSIWIDGNVGLAHSLLRTSAGDGPLTTVDGCAWIAADARIDAQDELRSRLERAGETVRADASDSDLILHAYRAFDTTFLDGLIGDFAFALWDARRRTLVCARDHFGVRPFVYARIKGHFVFASHIEALLAHPLVSTDLAPEAIGDFLLFGTSLDPAVSVYRDLSRLPPASMLRHAQGQVSIRRYWALLSEHHVEYRDSHDYVVQFEGLLRGAVKDRLRSDRVAMELTGGLDSASIAAVAATGTDSGITGYTRTCAGLCPDDREGHFADLVAAKLGIPIVFRPTEHYALFERHDRRELRTAEPASHAELAAYYDDLRHVAASSTRVLLTGQGGDALLAESPSYLADLVRRGRFFRAVREVRRHVRITGSPAGIGIRSLIRLRGSDHPHPPFPDWVNAEFSSSARLRTRYSDAWSDMRSGSGTYHQLSRPWLGAGLFEAYERLALPVIVRHPYFDLRLVRLLLSAPNCLKASKWLLRESMRGRLPESVRTRPKTPLAGDPMRAKLARGQVAVSMNLDECRAISPYVDSGRFGLAFAAYLDGAGADSTWSSHQIVAPIALASWLQQGPATRQGYEK